jgi:hypothetical protein
MKNRLFYVEFGVLGGTLLREREYLPTKSTLLWHAIGSPNTHQYTPHER